MKVLVTGVAGQLGHDVMNELADRNYEGIGSDIATQYSGIMDETAVTKMPYIQLDITDKESVRNVISKEKPDVVVHCAAWTAVELAEDAQVAHGHLVHAPLVAGIDLLGGVQEAGDLALGIIVVFPQFPENFVVFFHAFILLSVDLPGVYFFIRLM